MENKKQLTASSLILETEKILKSMDNYRDINLVYLYAKGIKEIETRDKGAK